MKGFGNLTTKERYGLLLAINLGRTFNKNKPLTLTEISEKENLSLKYLERLVVPFKKAKWVISQRGREGGYIMIKNPTTISLKDIVLLFCEECCLVSCLSGIHKGKCPNFDKCTAKKAWAKIQKALVESMESIKLSELI